MKYLPLFFVLSGCLPTYYAGNIKVFDKQVSSSMTRVKAEYLFEHTLRDSGWGEVIASMGVNRNQRKWLQDTLSEFDFVFTSGWLATRAPDGSVFVANGLTDLEEQVVYLRVAGCYGDTALVHEIGHIVRWKAGLGPDAFHEDTVFWDKVNGMNDKLLVDLCKPGYTKEEPPMNFTIGE